jgi:hypothetical protein
LAAAPTTQPGCCATVSAPSRGGPYFWTHLSLFISKRLPTRAPHLRDGSELTGEQQLWGCLVARQSDSAMIVQRAVAYRAHQPLWTPALDLGCSFSKYRTGNKLLLENENSPFPMARCISGYIAFITAAFPHGNMICLAESQDVGRTVWIFSARKVLRYC